MLLLPILEKSRVEMNDNEKKVVKNEYAFARLERCPFGNEKPTCGSCSIHCYKPEKKEQIKKVMQFAGPRMLLLSPIVTLQHFYKEYKRKRLYG